jgi:hypothetical protein
MAKIIEFPSRTPVAKQTKWLPASERGKVIEFPRKLKNSA